jgi:hypothetical protein
MRSAFWFLPESRPTSNGIGDDGSEQEPAALAIRGGCSPELKENMLPEQRLPMRKDAKCCASSLNRNSAPGSMVLVAAICTVGKATVRRYPQRLEAAGLSWPLPADLDDVALGRRLFPPSTVASPDERCLPDWRRLNQKHLSDDRHRDFLPVALFALQKRDSMPCRDRRCSSQ